MTGQGNPSSTRCLRFVLGVVLVFLVSMFCLVDRANSVHAGESVQGESSTQNMDTNHRDHADGTVEAMIPHQQHAGPHMRWTTLGAANPGDAQRADQIVQALRQTLAKYKDYRVP